MNKFFFKSKLESESTSKGLVAGVAYSGSIIDNYMWYQNFIVDTDTLTIAKDKIALLKDHMAEKVIGHAVATIEENQVKIDGKISKGVEVAQEVITLAEDGFDWEMSIGVYDGHVEEGFSGEVNGQEVENVNVLRNGVLREVSIVALGADMNTNAKIFNKDSTKENEMNAKDRKRLVKAFKLATDAEIEEIVEKAEEIAAEVEEAKTEVEEVKEEVNEKDTLIDSLQKRIEELEAALDAINGEAEVEERVEEIEASLKEKGIDLSAEKIKEIAKSEDTAKLFLGTIKEAKVLKAKIDSKFCQKQNFEKSENTKNLREQAAEMVKLGTARNFIEAISSLVGKGE